MGRPCCAVFRCVEPLQNNRHRYCATHFAQHNICAVRDCNLPVVVGSKTCVTPLHRKMEKINTERGKAAFTLKERYQHARVSHPNDSTASTGTLPDDLEENVGWFEVEGEDVHMFIAPNQGSVGVGDADSEAVLPCESSKSALGNRKIKAQFGRRRTHNEQTLVRPCGIIFARATFFGAEAVSNVLVSLSISI
jgi:CxC6 like cysteine cluster associated with KDZ transposases